MRDGVPVRESTNPFAAVFICPNSVESIEVDSSKSKATFIPQNPGHAGFWAAFAQWRAESGSVTVVLFDTLTLNAYAPGLSIGYITHGLGALFSTTM